MENILNKMNKSQLVEILKEKNLSTAGNKIDLINRILEIGNDIQKTDGSNQEEDFKLETEDDDSSQVKILKTEIYYLKMLNTELYGKISMQQTVINLLQEERHINKVTTTETDKVKTFTRPMKDKPGIIIKPRNNIHKPNEIIKDLQENIKPNDLAINITKMKTTNNGVIIQCDKEEEVSTLKANIEKTLGEKYKPDLLKTYRPRIIINGLKNIQEMENEDIKKNIINENSLKEKKQEKDFYLQVIIKMYNKKYKDTSLVIEVDTKTYQFLNQEGGGKLNLAWNRANIKDHIHVRRCTNCWSFNHHKTSCDNPRICIKCGESESSDHQCEPNNVQVKCKNCVEANKKFSANLNINHGVTDRDCPCYQRIYNQIKNKVNYDNVNF